MSTSSELPVDSDWNDVQGEEFRWPSSLGLWMVAIYLVLFLIRPWEELLPWMQTIRFERIYAILMLLAVLLTGRRLTFSRQTAAVALFAAAVGISAVRAWQPESSWPIFYQYATVVVTYFAMIVACRQMTDVNWLIVTYIGTMYVYLGKSLWEYFVHDRHEFAQDVSRLVGIEFTYGEPNAVAMSAVLSMPLWYYLWKCRRSLAWDVSPCWSRGFTLILATYPGVAAVAVALTNSRAGMIGLAAFVAGVVWYSQGQRNRIRALVLIAVVVLGLWCVAPAEQKDRLRTLWNPQAGPANARASAGGRWEGFVAAMQMLADRPITGVGVGNFVPYRTAYVDGISLVAHNLPGQILGETGWLGGFCFMLVVVAAWRNTQRILIDCDEWCGQEIFCQLAVALQLSLLLSLLFGLSLHNGLRYNWLWIAAFGSLAWEFLPTSAGQADDPPDRDPQGGIR